MIFLLIYKKSELEPFYACHRSWQGIPSIERTKNGRTFITFYSGSTVEGFGNYQLLLMKDGVLTDFGEPVAVAYNGENSRCFDGALWIDPLERLWFIWNLQPENEIWAAVCDNPDADTLCWSKPFHIGNGVMINRPTVLSTGEWLFPIAVWGANFNTNMRNKTDETPAAYVYKTVDNGKSFTKLGGADIRDKCFDEHMILEKENGVLQVFVRTHYGIGTSYSYDRGLSWSNGEDSKLPGANSRFHIKRLPSGRVLLVSHFENTGRNNLTAMLSEDDGKTFKYHLLLDERDYVSYPDAVLGEDGFIYVVYDRERGYYKTCLEEAYKDAREILIAKFTEEDILKGELVTKGSCLKNIASKLTVLCDTDPDPFEKKTLTNTELAEKLITDGGDIISSLFTLCPINCEKYKKVEISKLDGMIDNFNKTDKKDAVLLEKIISFIKNIPYEENENYPVIKNVLSYIEENLKEEFSVNSLAEELGISIYYLCHLFKKVTGTTIIEYRNELRFTMAKKYLVSTDKSIAEISAEIGFGNSSYFTKLFTKHEKITPTEYRKLHKK